MKTKITLLSNKLPLMGAVLLTVVWLHSCTNSTPTSDATPRQDTLQPKETPPKPPVPQRVSGKVTFQVDECPDGANYPGRSSGGIQSPPKPMKGLKLWVCIGDTISDSTVFADSVTTDKDGSYQLELIPGTYSLAVEAQILPLTKTTARFPKSKHFALDRKCFERWRSTPQITFVVAERSLENQDISLVFNENVDVPSRCIKFFCLNPMAPPLKGQQGPPSN